MHYWIINADKISHFKVSEGTEQPFCCLWCSEWFCLKVLFRCSLCTLYSYFHISEKRKTKSKFLFRKGNFILLHSVKLKSDVCSQPVVSWCIISLVLQIIFQRSRLLRLFSWLQSHLNHWIYEELLWLIFLH